MRVEIHTKTIKGIGWNCDTYSYKTFVYSNVDEVYTFGDNISFYTQGAKSTHPLGDIARLTITDD